MTFDSTAHSIFADVAPEQPSPRSSRRSNVHVEIQAQQKDLPTPSKVRNNDESNETLHLENESGVLIDFSYTDNGRSGGNVSLVEGLLGKAQSHFDQNDIESAVVELTAAAERLKTHHNLVHESMNEAISYLSAKGSRSTPPHPKALSLIRLRNTLPA